MEPETFPIGAHAAIGDCRSLALVATGGSIDWFCPGVFSAPSLFAALLDTTRGGQFAVGCPAALLQRPPAQTYVSGTNVLQTRFEVHGGVLLLTDFMRFAPEEVAEPPRQEIVRIVECLEGEADIDIRFEPRPGYATQTVAPVAAGPLGFRFTVPGLPLALFASRPLHPEEDGLTARWRLRAGERDVLVMHTAATDPPASAEALRAYALAQLTATTQAWQQWAAQMKYAGPYRDAVLRSALALKLLTHGPTGAVVAAATTSIPEDPSGNRNWDYRYCWLRDSSLVLRGFVDLGFEAESDAFLRWLLHATRSTEPRLQVVYDVHGEANLPERVLPQLRGYQGIGPVLVGNAAAQQVQLDVYGEVLLTAWEHARRGGKLDEAEKAMLAGLCERVCAVWQEPDQGIWEVRLPPRQNTHSKLMCWAALQCGLDLQASHGVPLDAHRLTQERDRIRADIEAHGFNTTVQSYVGYYGSDAADAALLLIPRLGYLPPQDPRVLGTVKHVFSQLQVHGLLYRYPPDSGYDGVKGAEHLFAICNFWAVDCLARVGRLREARQMYEALLALRNAVGLYAEEFGVEDGRPIGNFPQAFSHVGLLTAALTLAEVEASGAGAAG